MTRGHSVLFALLATGACVLIAMISSAVLDHKPIPNTWIESPTPLPACLSIPPGTNPFPPCSKPGREDQCEKLDVNSSVMEVENTWSNMGYLFVGLMILFRNWTGKRLFAGIFGGSMICLAWLSGLYHAQPVFDLYRHMDVATIYWVLPLLIAYAFNGIFVYRVSDTRTESKGGIVMVSFLIFAAGSTIPFLVHPLNVDSTIMAGILIAVLMIAVVIVLLIPFRFITDSEFLKKLLPGWLFDWLCWPLKILRLSEKFSKELLDVEKAAYLTGLMLLLLPTFFFRLGDGRLGDFNEKKKLLCSETSPFQAHAGWHIFSALTLWLGFELFARAFSDEANLLPALRPDKWGQNDH